MNDVSGKFNQLRKIFKNCRSLIRDAEILYEHGSYKRSMFLAICAYEEFVKMGMVVEDEKKVFSHPKKFETLHFEIGRILQLKVANQMQIIMKDHAQKIDLDPKLGEKLRDFESQTLSLFKDALNFEKIRTSLIYEDSEDTIHKQLVNESGIENISKAFLDGIRGLTDHFVDHFS